MNERLTDNRLKTMIDKLDGTDPHGIAIGTDEFLVALRELRLLRAQCDDQAALILRLEHRLFAKGLDHD